MWEMKLVTIVDGGAGTYNHTRKPMEGGKGHSDIGKNAPKGTFAKRNFRPMGI